jgi:hypothetical protein
MFGDRRPSQPAVLPEAVRVGPIPTAGASQRSEVTPTPLAPRIRTQSSLIRRTFDVSSATMMAASGQL